MKCIDWVRVGSMAACAALATAATGGLIVYEGFDCTATNNAPLTGLAGATSFGFGSDSVWTKTGEAEAAFRVDGLNLPTSQPGLLATHGGAAFIRSAVTDWQRGRTSRPLGVAANEIWGSFLFRRISDRVWDNTQSGLSLLIAQSTTTNDDGAELNVAAKEWGTSRGGVRSRTTRADLGGTATSFNQTVLVLFKATNLNASSGDSVLRAWMLTGLQFQHFKAGGLSEEDLDGAALGTGAAQVLQRGEVVRSTAPRPQFSTSNHLMLHSIIGTIQEYTPNDTVSGIFDELRISNVSLDATTPIGPGIAVDNAMGGSPIASNATALRGTVVSPGDTSVDVHVFWGTVDKGTDASAWAHSALVASDLSGSAAVGTNLAHVITGISRDIGIQYRYAVSNAVDGLVWAPASAQAAGTFSIVGYQKRMPIDFDGYTGTEVLTNFPALVRLTAEQLGAAVNGVGHDLRFTDNDGTPLNHEIDSWSVADGWNVWVQVPFLTSATRIWMYANNAEVAGYPSYYARQGGAWSSEFRGVWHLGENVVNNQDGGVHADSTVNLLDAIQRGNGPVPGVVGRAQRVEKANNEYMIVTNKFSAALDVGSRFTLSSWVRWEGAAPTSNSRLFGRKNHFQDPHGFEIIQFYQTTSPNHQFWVRGAGTSGTLPTYQCTTLSAVSTTWWHMTIRFNGTTATVYKDGELVGSGTILAAADNDVELYIGNFGALTGAFNGDFDEVRLEGTLRSADWIRAVWKNMADNAVFQRYGAVDSLGASVILIR